ncbi:M23 family metallopeptidase [Jeotgalibacillus marinus]|uniref:M23 family metallopeptidase n=1 Tax=Jeotgalibacillus marinus TaxID=86667 RepID=A0ABV3Q5J4_9BACL
MRFLLSTVVVFVLFSSVVSSENKPQSREKLLNERMEYYVQYSAMHFIPWYYLAAVDQFERNIQLVRDDLPSREGPIAIQFDKKVWAGKANPYKEGKSPSMISFFGGQGKDGNDNGYADRNDIEDVLFTMADYLSEYGQAEEDFKVALMDYYKREESVNQIMTIAKIYKHFDTLDLYNYTFPLSLNHNFSYRSTWGDSRGWGGRRMHEGTDLFASSGVPVLATTNGIVEVAGWNDFGGWRIGIRDVHNTYHYYAHLSGFSEEIKEGDIVKTGTVIGYVGSSGYGKEGTSGKFPPHLHYGMYRDNGRTEWAFDPYPSLRIWEKQTRNQN